MQLFIKTLISILIILGATWIGRKFPSLSGLIAVMPLTGALVLVWMYLDNKGNPEVMENFTKGAIFGIVPSILFFVVALFCFKRQLPLPVTLSASFAVWFVAAFVHQWFLR